MADLEGKKIKVTIVCYLDDLKAENYRFNDPDGDGLTDEQLEALTAEDICRMERQMLLEGAQGIDELVGNADPDLQDDVTFEVVDA